MENNARQKTPQNEKNAKCKQHKQQTIFKNQIIFKEYNNFLTE